MRQCGFCVFYFCVSFLFAPFVCSWVKLLITICLLSSSIVLKMYSSKIKVCKKTDCKGNNHFSSAVNQGLMDATYFRYKRNDDNKKNKLKLITKNTLYLVCIVPSSLSVFRTKIHFVVAVVFVDSVIFKMPLNPAEVNTTKYLARFGEKFCKVVNRWEKSCKLFRMSWLIKKIRRYTFNLSRINSF